MTCRDIKKSSAELLVDIQADGKKTKREMMVFDCHLYWIEMT